MIHRGLNDEILAISDPPSHELNFLSAGAITSGDTIVVEIALTSFLVRSLNPSSILVPPASTIFCINVDLISGSHLKTDSLSDLCKLSILFG